MRCGCTILSNRLKPADLAELEHFVLTRRGKYRIMSIVLIGQTKGLLWQRKAPKKEPQDYRRANSGAGRHNGSPRISQNRPHNRCLNCDVKPMAKYHCVLDASALIKKYHKEKGSEVIEALFEHEDSAIHVLNVAIPEVIGTFFRWQLQGQLKPAQRQQLKEIFLADVRSYKIIVHNITDRNIVGTDVIWETSNKKKTKPRIGPVDVLVISVCRELQTSYRTAHLFSSDEHMLKVSAKLGIHTYNPEEIKKLPFE